MRKFTLFLLALLATTITFANVNNGARLQFTKAIAQQRMAQVKKDAKVARNNVKRVAPRGLLTFDQQPEGKVVELIASYGGIYYSYFFGAQNISTTAGAVTLVEGTDGNLYIKGLTPALYDDILYWIKAEKTGDGEYVVKKQPAGYYSSYDEVDYLTVLDYDDEEGWFVEAANTELKLTYKDGVLAQADPDLNYGIVYEDEGEWEWEGEVYWELTAEPMTETYATLPEGAKAEEFVLQHKDGAKAVQLAVVGNEVYVQSYEDVPGWYVGTINGNKVTFKSGQFLGYDSHHNSYEWLVAGTVTQEYDEEYDEYYDNGIIADELTFDYDAEAKTLTAPENTALYINGSKETIYYAEAYVNPKFFIFTEVAATPADPVITYFWPYDEDYESAELDFNIPLADVDGNYITPDKLSYRLYVDDAPFTFGDDEYELGQDYDELPYGFTAGYWIGEEYLCIFFDPAKNIGLQSIYRGAGVENVSNIVYYDVQNDEIYTVDKDGNLVDGIILSRNNGSKAIATYDLAGRRVSDNARGLLLKTITLGDGTQKTVKVIKK